MFTVYVLYSTVYKKIYINHTADLENRLRSHNALATKEHPIQYRTWELFYFEEYVTKEEALVREEELKTKEGREYLWEMIRNRPRIM
ncbi:MAG: GIY-YIG nuclease family protein [Sphingobacteriaceae bacterium]|nr:GIY-YIG nuclease family protein [Sphingobacteriaceae bacterium]